jgi:hypothetical protein
MKTACARKLSTLSSAFFTPQLNYLGILEKIVKLDRGYQQVVDRKKGPTGGSVPPVGG